MSLLENKLKDFEHTFNPLHLFCRLAELGIDKEVAKSFIRTYEKKVYIPVISYYNYLEKKEKEYK